jgi:16S rRNA processing protein RimM
VNTAPTEPVVVGTISGTHGRAGAVRVDPQSDIANRFMVGSELFINGIAHTVDSSQPSGRGIIIKLDKINDLDHAATLKGSLITIPSHHLEALPDGSYYYYEIIGINVWEESGVYIGKISEIISTGCNDVYVIKDSLGHERLIPALDDVLLSVVPQKKQMVVRIPEGL